MAFGAPTHRSLPSRGASPGFRFTLYAIVSTCMMFLDQRSGWLNGARYWLQAVAYPVQVAVSYPSAISHWMHESFETRGELRAQNQRLRAMALELNARTLRYEALARENAALRGLATALPSVAERWLPAEIVNVELNSLRQRILLNRGTRNRVFRGQAVLDQYGLLGQTTHVGPWSAEVILITDAEHAVPVQIARTGLRTIAVGTGNAGVLALPYLPSNADIKRGDLLITSGLGGVFPAGYPVARVVEVHRDAVQPLAQVRAMPLAHIDSDREVMLLWFREGHPAAPVNASHGELKTGLAEMQPQAALSRKPVAPPAAASSARPADHPIAAPSSPFAAPPVAPVSQPARRDKSVTDRPPRAFTVAPAAAQTGGTTEENVAPNRQPSPPAAGTDSENGREAAQEPAVTQPPPAQTPATQEPPQ